MARKPTLRVLALVACAAAAGACSKSVGSAPAIKAVNAETSTADVTFTPIPSRTVEGLSQSETSGGGTVSTNYKNHLEAGENFQLVEVRIKRDPIATFCWFADGSPVPVEWTTTSPRANIFDHGTQWHNNWDDWDTSSNFIAVLPSTPQPVEIGIIERPITAANRDQAIRLLEIVATCPMSAFHAWQFLDLLQEIGKVDNPAILKRCDELAAGTVPLTELKRGGKSVDGIFITTMSPAVLSETDEMVSTMRFCAGLLKTAFARPPGTPPPFPIQMAR